MTPYRYCATPGCTLHDFHPGRHSFEEFLPTKRKERHETTPTSDTKSGNKFIYDVRFVEMAMQNDQIGATIVISKRTDPPSRCTITVDKIESDTVYGTTKKGEVKTLTFDELVTYDNAAKWNPPGSATLVRHNASFIGKGHDAAAKRTEFNVKVLRDNIKTSNTQTCATVDGHGANREQYFRCFSDAAPDATPTLKTFEIQKIPALAQQLLYGEENIVWTGADYPFGYGCDGARSTTPSGIEYLLTIVKDTRGNPNRLVTKEFRDNLVFLNLDYCGGILGGLDFEMAQRTLLALLARLPRLVVLCLTFGKRQRPGVKYDFGRYAPTPYGFRIVHTFADASDNQRVVSRTFVRDFGIPRTLKVPGSMWFWNQSKSASGILRLANYKCVVKSFEAQTGTYIMYCIDDHIDNIAFRNLTIDILKEWTVEDEDAYCDDNMDHQMLFNEIKLLEQMRACLDEEIQGKRKALVTTTTTHGEMSEICDHAPIIKHVLGKTIKKVYHCRKCGQPKKGHICII